MKELKQNSLPQSRGIEEHGLLPRHMQFIQEYLKDFNEGAAYMRAGYKISYAGARAKANELLNVPIIKEFIRKELEIRRENTRVDSFYVVEQLKRVFDRCMQARPVMVWDYATKAMVQKTDEEGKGVWEFDSQGANKALELLGRHSGAFTTQFDVAKQQLLSEEQFDMLLNAASKPVDNNTHEITGEVIG